MDALHRVVRPGTIKYEHDCVAVHQTAEHATAKLADGSSIHANLVISADGIQSATRSAVRDTAPRFLGRGAWRGLVQIDDFPFGTVIETIGSGERVGLFGAGPGQVYWYAMSNRCAPGRPQQHPIARFGGYADPIRRVIEATPASGLMWTDLYDLVPAITWGVGRHTLIGDAAHAMSPDLGQGACQGMLDAATLARMVGRDLEPAALRRYERRRWPVATAVQIASVGAGRLRLLQNPILAAIRNTALRLAPTQVLRLTQA